MADPISINRARDRLPIRTGRVDRFERFRTNLKYGDLSYSALATVMSNASKGDISEWADLCEFAVGTSELLQSLYTTRISRVVQADWVVTPNEYGHTGKAELAAEFVDECLARVENWHEGLRALMHALAPGFSANEMEWDRDPVARKNYVRKIHHVHGHRMRYDLAWQLRLYDFGLRGGFDGYGEMLDPRTWIVHTHQEQMGYPGIAGIMRSCIYAWLSHRLARKWELGSLESHGKPLTYAQVSPNTPDAVREQILTDLENLSADHVAVLEEGVELNIDATAAAAKSYEAFRAFADAMQNDMTVAWLGIEDAVNPGESGSQAAVSTRAGIAVDPRMVADGDGLATTLHQTLFKRLIMENGHLFPGVPDDIPVPMLRFKTADDEVVPDKEDRAEERIDEEASPDEPLDVRDEQPDEEKAPPEIEATAIPKARPRKGRTVKTSQTSFAWTSPLEAALRGELAGRESS